MSNFFVCMYVHVCVNFSGSNQSCDVENVVWLILMAALAKFFPNFLACLPSVWKNLAIFEPWLLASQSCSFPSFQPNIAFPQLFLIDHPLSIKMYSKMENKFWISTLGSMIKLSYKFVSYFRTDQSMFNYNIGLHKS